MEDVENRNVLVRTDVKLSRMLALCSEPTVMYGRGKQLFRGIARGTQPQVITYWLILWIIATRDATLHERLVNMLVGKYHTIYVKIVLNAWLSWLKLAALGNFHFCEGKEANGAPEN